MFWAGQVILNRQPILIFLTYLGPWWFVLQTNFWIGWRGRLHKGSRSLFGHHLFIFHHRTLIFICGRNGCFFGILELQVRKKHATPPSKMSKNAIFGLKIAIFHVFCHLSNILLNIYLIILVLNKIRPSDAIWTLRDVRLQMAIMPKVAVLGQKWSFLPLFLGCMWFYDVKLKYLIDAPISPII